MRFSARLLLSFFFCVLLFFLVTTRIQAQTIPASNSAATNYYTAPNTNPDVPKNLHTWTQNVMIETMSALVCQLAGVDPVNPNQNCLGVDNQTGKIGFVKNGGGAIGLMQNAIGMLYTPPTHTGEYFQNLASNFGFVKSAHAQSTGTGFQSLIPLLGIWTAFRNIVYLLLVLVFVIIGLAIMLRIKIDPRTVMTVQNQIPKIIVGLILVTFSFAIAGFLIDIMYTTIYLTGNAIAQTDPELAKTNTDIVRKVTLSTNPLGAANQISPGVGFTNIVTHAASSVAGDIKPVFDNLPGRIIMTALGLYIGNTVGKNAGKIAVSGLIAVDAVLGVVLAPFTSGASIPISAGIYSALNWLNTPAGAGTAGAIGAAVGAGGGAILGPNIASLVVSVIAFLIISIAMLFALFRLWFTLISAYVFLLLDVVSAPFWIFAGLIPGSPVSFGLWLRDIVSNLAAFPVAIIMFLLGRVFVDAFGTNQIVGQFVPPLIGNPSSTSAIGSLIGLGFILLTPNVVNMTKAALKAPKFDVTPIKQALGSGGGTTFGTARTIGQTQLAAQEQIMTATGWRARGRGLASLGRIFR